MLKFLLINEGESYSIVCSPLSARRGGWISYQIFKKGGLTGRQLLEGGWWETGGDVFQGGGGVLQFHNEEFKLENFN